MLVGNGERFLAVGDMLKRVGKIIESVKRPWEMETLLLVLSHTTNLNVEGALYRGVLTDHRSLLRYDMSQTPFTTIFAASTNARSHMEDKRLDLLPPAAVDCS